MPTTAKTSRYEAGLIILLFLTVGTVMMDRMSQLFLGPYLVRDLNLTPGQIGLLASVVGLGWAFSALVFGAVSDRIGRRAVLIPAVALFSLFSWVSGVVHSYHELLLARGLLGLAEGPCWSVISALMAESSPIFRRGRNVGIALAAAPLIGNGLAPIITTRLADLLGWRDVFFIVGIPGMILAVLLFLFVREPDRANRPLKPPGGFANLAAVLKRRNVVLACLAAIGQGTWLIAFATFAPLYITQVQHQTADVAGLLLGGTGIGAFLIGLAGPALSDRFGRRTMIVSAAALSGLMPLLFMVPALYAHLPIMVPLIVMTSAGSATAALVLVLVPSDAVPPHLAGIAIGLCTFFAEFFGAAVAPSLGGRLAESFGLTAPLLLASGGMALAMIAGLLMQKPGSPRATLALPISHPLAKES